MAKQFVKSFSTINCYARNQNRPDLEMLLEISKILEVDLKDLIMDENERV
ncbi:MAG: transcriptional regulator [Prevotella sp.]|nr:transcriptional regulator [Prevotella sp.]MDY5665774.1 transcriptional regulator [Alloprevotella sp.]